MRNLRSPRVSSIEDLGRPSYIALCPRLWSRLQFAPDFSTCALIDCSDRGMLVYGLQLSRPLVVDRRAKPKAWARPQCHHDLESDESRAAHVASSLVVSTRASAASLRLSLTVVRRAARLSLVSLLEAQIPVIPASVRSCYERGGSRCHAHAAHGTVPTRHDS